MTRAFRFEPIWVTAFGLFVLGMAPAQGADHFVPASVPLIKPDYDAGIRPGDTLTLAAGRRGTIRFENLAGTAEAPIVIRNDPRGTGPVVVDVQPGGGGNHVFFWLRHCTHVHVDGSFKWNGAPAGRTYGIKVTTSGPSPSHFVMFNGTSNFGRIRNVEVDGRWPEMETRGIGIGVNDHWVNQEDQPGTQWREGFIIERCYVHRVHGEGLYIGPNWSDLDGKEPWRLRNIEIRDNLVTDTGWNAMDLKSAIEGANLIHHNVCKRVGKRVDNAASQHNAIMLYESMGEIYSNWVEDAGESGISHYLHNMPASVGTKTAKIYNNVVVNTGLTGPQDGRGITSGSGPNQPKVYAMIFNNTVVRPESHGITIGNAQGGVLRDNIIVEAGGSAEFASSPVTRENNRAGTLAAMKFRDAAAGDFHLTEGSPARNAGSASGFPPADYDGIARPQEGRSDQGAYEFVRTADPSAPAAPGGLQVE
ncbi:MAG: right-handed parallel beta-helix repeat-containing protein [Kiritimatiellae bacterium]|nr:right-handed parallel beta-helix repeat-containing protein [Kiritimatiellia bacterium]